MDFLHGKLEKAQLREIEDDCIRHAIKLQQEAGLKIFSDGEFRRDFWLSAVSDEFFEGMENHGIDYTRHSYLRGKEIKNSEAFVPPNPIVKGKLARKKRITRDEIDFLKANAPGAFKMTIPSPVTLSRSSYQQGVTDKIYPSWENLFLEYAHLVAAEVSDMVNDGVTYVQLDAPHYTRFVIPNRQKQITDLGVDLRRELELAIAAENICLRAARHAGTAASANITTAVHICLGTFILGPQGPLGGAGEYDETLVAHLIEALDADLFLIEYSERTGSLEAFRNLPKNKIISLGIVNTRDPRVETPDEIKYRVDGAARYIPIENLSICPNCGFSGAAVETWVTEDIEKRKLEVLVRTSEQIWG
jgi:5-methyltetrahydropteroyltriglutamate--homocysteine methyltransferase